VRVRSRTVRVVLEANTDKNVAIRASGRKWRGRSIVAVDAVATDIDAALSRATMNASRAIDRGDVGAAVADLEKCLGKAAKIAGE